MSSVQKTRVAVLMGGNSAERTVSLSTGKQILNALNPSKYDVAAYDSAAVDNFGDPNVHSLVDLITLRPEARPDVVFIALHGPGGEDGTVQGMLEVLGIPYTGSGVLASALAIDKAMSKRVLTSAGILMPPGVVLHNLHADRHLLEALAFPCVVKPNRQGSTIGMTIVPDREFLEAALNLAFAFDDTVVIESFVKGVEITVPVLGNRRIETLPIVEIVPASGVYDFESKYTPGATEEIVPARLADDIAERARDIALACHRVLGCAGMSRTDMIVSPGGDIYTLEVNTIPGMTPTSLLPRAAEAAGISFDVLLDRLINFALELRACLAPI